ncbi:MAG: hypothetical protein WD118_11950 [Phycisphaeraceae bacterium]
MRRVTAGLTPEQKRIAEDWNLDLGSVTPGWVWNLQAKKLAVEGGLGAAGGGARSVARDDAVGGFAPGADAERARALDVGRGA